MSNATDLSIAEEFAARVRRENQRNRITQIAPIIVLLVIIGIFGILNKDFISGTNFITILAQLSVPLIVSLGVTFVVLMGSIDLSVDGIMGLTAAVVSLMVLNTKTGLNLGIIGILITVVIGAAAGFTTGLIHVKAKIPSFMVSFGMSSVAAGIALITYSGIPATIKDTMLRGIALNKFLGIPVLTWIAFIVFVVAFILQEYTPFGRYVYAIGDDESIPRQAGINVDRVKILAFTWSGLCIGLGGIIGSARLGRGTVLVGKGNLFPVMTAVVVGGTALSGGKGGVLNTLLGAAIVTVLQNGLVLMGVDPYFQAAIQGVIIIIAVAFSVTRGRGSVMK